MYTIVERGIDGNRWAISLYENFASLRRLQIRERVEGDSSCPLARLISNSAGNLVRVRKVGKEGR